MYSPKIADDLIPELYVMGKTKNKPMTVVVDELLRLGMQITKIIEQPNHGGYHESNQSNLAGGNIQS